MDDRVPPRWRAVVAGKGLFMNRQSPRSLRHRKSGFNMAEGLVTRVAELWKKGLPIGLARKILRKQGISPWSLLLAVEGEAWERIVLELRVPEYFKNACSVRSGACGQRTLEFWELGKSERLPDGLVVWEFNLLFSETITRLPRRLWARNVSVVDCLVLRSLEGSVVPPGHLQVLGCPRLKALPERFGPRDGLTLRDCAAIEEVTAITRHPGDWSYVNLERLPRLKRLHSGGPVQNLHVQDCPNLKSIAGFLVLQELEINRCAVLETLPRFGGPVSGRVLDCPGLAGSYLIHAPLPEGSTLEFMPLRGACRLPPAERIPAAQPVEVRALLPPSDFTEGSAWPWPPF